MATMSVRKVLEANVREFLLANNSSRSAKSAATPLGPLLLTDLGFAQQEAAQRPGQGRVTLVGQLGSKVSLSGSVLQALPVSAILALLRIRTPDNQSQELFQAATRGFLVSTPAMDVSVFDEDGQHVRVRLPDPILLKLPDLPNGTAVDANQLVCAYLDTAGPGVPSWSREGVWRASSAEVLAAGEDPAGIWCWTSHLSIFAAILDAVLGCTNLELFSESAVEMIVLHEGWYTAQSAIITFSVMALLLQTVLVGNLWEMWQLRLGRTHAVGKPVTICHNFMTWGPQVLKHRYAVFLVYARDVMQMITADKTKLKNSSLISGVQRFLAVRTGISVSCVAGHCWNGGGWIEPKASIPRTTLCRKFEFHGGYAEEVMERDLLSEGLWNRVRRFSMTVVALHPLLDAMRIGPGSMTVGKRTMLQVCGLFGVVATNAMIFSFSGSLREWEADASCPIERKNDLFILVATLVSILINAMPNAFMTDVARQVHGRPMWDLAFWFLVAMFLAITGLLICSALANLNTRDQAKWYASLEWSMSIKLFGMPLLQGIRHTFLLETFRRVDARCEPSKQFKVVMGLCHQSEKQLSDDVREEAATVAKQAISAAELVRFTSLLGDTVMLNFNPETSTSDDVMNAAIKPLCIKPPALDELPVVVSVEAIQGLLLSRPDDRVSCSVLHLGDKSKQERPCLSEEWSKSSATSSGGSPQVWRFPSPFESNVAGLHLGHALGFVVREGDRDVGIACLPAEDVLRRDGAEWRGELLLHRPEGGEEAGGTLPRANSTGSFVLPAQAAMVASLSITGSRGLETTGRASLLQHARVSVKVSVPKAYTRAVAMHERQKFMGVGLTLQSEVPLDSAEISASLARVAAPGAEEWTSELSCRPFCEPVVPPEKGADGGKQQGGKRPPDRMVVHSKQGTFLSLVAHVLADALGHKEAFLEVHQKLRERDFPGLLDMLRNAGCEETRYWIDMFALDPRSLRGGAGQSDWHEALMCNLPTILRSLRGAVCRWAVSEIEAGSDRDTMGTLTQLLIIDRKFHFMHESPCLAEMMLARAMRIRQKILLHPDHASSPDLGAELDRVAQDFETEFHHKELPWTSPFLEDKQAVYDTLKDLTVTSVKQQRGDEPSIWSQLSMTNLAVTLAQVQAGRGGGGGGRSRAPAAAGGDAGGAEDLAGVDAGVDADL